MRGAEPAVFAERARRRHGVLLPQPRPGTGELPMQVNATLLRTDPADLARRFMESQAEA